MRTVAQNKMLDNFINYFGKIPEYAEIKVLQKLINEQYDGNYIQIRYDKIVSTYFVGIKKDFNDYVVEKIA